jgi:hypothetical protein
VNNATLFSVDRQFEFISQEEVNLIAFLLRFAFGFAINTKTERSELMNTFEIN